MQIHIAMLFVCLDCSEVAANALSLIPNRSLTFPPPSLFHTFKKTFLSYRGKQCSLLSRAWETTHLGSSTHSAGGLVSDVAQG